jgi:hypothetical protein
LIINNSYNRNKRKWIVKLVDEKNDKFIAETYSFKLKEDAKSKVFEIESKYGHAWLYSWTIEKIIKDILTKHNIDCSVRNGASKTNKPMSYSIIENYIIFNQDYIVALCMDFLLPAIEAIKAITYHEIGHYLDFQLNPEKKQIALKLSTETRAKFKIDSEHKAWQYGLILVPEDLKLLYNDINETNIRLYEKKYCLC